MADLEQARRDYRARAAEVFRGPRGRLVNVSAQRAREDALLEAAGVQFRELEAELAAKAVELQATRAIVEAKDAIIAQKDAEIAVLTKGGDEEMTLNGGLR